MLKLLLNNTPVSSLSKEPCHELLFPLPGLIGTVHTYEWRQREHLFLDVYINSIGFIKFNLCILPCTPVFLALGSLRQKGLMFDANRKHIIRSVYSRKHREGERTEGRRKEDRKKEGRNNLV